MQITEIKPISFQGRKLIPIKDYDGVILKLTKADKKKIEAVQGNINIYDSEIELLKNMSKKAQTDSAFDYFYNKIWHLEQEIERAKNYILEIKTNRLNKQKAKLNKKNLDVNA